MIPGGTPPGSGPGSNFPPAPFPGGAGGFPGGAGGFPGGGGGFPGGAGGFPGGGGGFPGGAGGFPGGGGGFPPMPFPGGGGGFPSGPPQGGPGGGPGGPGGPQSPPPSFTPQKPGGGGVSALAVDPGSIRRCINRYVYIWQNNGDSYWMFLTQVGRNSISGFRWYGYGSLGFWLFFGLDIRRVEQFTCF
ncbi:hypothetical protein G9U52_24420 [Paenibacillus sp. S3N08]|uniref:Collagen-like protein n=2 Tax=Paenibacillus agricola TaxID=2716264 RepID=A0ABX0JFG7_9BACL|nr:hypothetical protein [Paenibacillus agricola]